MDSVRWLWLVAGALPTHGGHDAAAQILRRDAQDQCRRVGGAAERRAHLALCGEGARPLRQALHRRQHHPVRRRAVADRQRGCRAGLGARERRRRRDRPRHEGAADLGSGAAHAAGLHGGGRHQDARRISRASGSPPPAAASAASTGAWAAPSCARPASTSSDAQFIPSPTAGRLPGLIAGQIDGVALHPEDVYLAKKQKPTLNVLL